jgi:hypothetical protein
VDATGGNEAGTIPTSADTLKAARVEKAITKAINAARRLLKDFIVYFLLTKNKFGFCFGFFLKGCRVCGREGCDAGGGNA